MKPYPVLVEYLTTKDPTVFLVKIVKNPVVLFSFDSWVSLYIIWPKVKSRRIPWNNFKIFKWHFPCKVFVNFTDCFATILASKTVDFANITAFVDFGHVSCLKWFSSGKLPSTYGMFFTLSLVFFHVLNTHYETEAIQQIWIQFVIH